MVLSFFPTHRPVTEPCRLLHHPRLSTREDQRRRKRHFIFPPRNGLFFLPFPPQDLQTPLCSSLPHSNSPLSQSRALSNPCSTNCSLPRTSTLSDPIHSVNGSCHPLSDLVPWQHHRYSSWTPDELQSPVLKVPSGNRSNLQKRSTCVTRLLPSLNYFSTSIGTSPKTTLSRCYPLSPVLPFPRYSSWVLSLPDTLESTHFSLPSLLPRLPVTIPVYSWFLETLVGRSHPSLFFGPFGV